MSASVGVRPLNGSLEDKEIEDDPKMKIYPWMRRMHASQNKRGKNNFEPPIELIRYLSDYRSYRIRPRTTSRSTYGIEKNSNSLHKTSNVGIRYVLYVRYKSDIFTLVPEIEHVRNRDI